VLAALTTFDLAVVGVCLLFALRGGLKGFVWQSLRLLGLLAALWGASAGDDWLAARLRGLLPTLSETAAPFVAWGSIFVVLLVLTAWAAHKARGVVEAVDLTGLDRAAGFVLGAVWGLFCATVLLVVGGALLDAFGERARLETLVQGSRLAEPMGEASRALGDLLPHGVREVWDGARRAQARDVR
jgi:uncharacterized membrane protein required for colicin V production